MLGLIGAVAIPCLVAARGRYRPEEAFGGWLMPVVPPMVSASAGALLLPHAPAGLPREALLWGCYALFALSLAASLLVTSLIVRRLVRHGVGAPGAVPTLWIVLGFAGQSATAVNLLADRAPLAADDAVAGSLLRFAVAYGALALGFALLWTALALVLTLRAVRRGLPFSLTWWSFTFPVGTCATGLSALAGHTGLTAVTVLAVAYCAGLVAAWCVVGARTLHGVAIRGDLLLPPR
ncbi:hypothetical protein NBM05_11150 [Rothia sp. AR01]|uniref:C4-dicarboxylate ABC transporter n=1 Tax=Rothia santali TaxID=2949643 RepID=A0A9X2HIY2_9MICC|nr:hypothetical protein [Rothia santali]MCP3426541.1 hypothetical protein [Rothia santali]